MRLHGLHVPKTTTGFRDGTGNRLSNKQCGSGGGTEHCCQLSYLVSRSRYFFSPLRYQFFRLDPSN